MGNLGRCGNNDILPLESSILFMVLYVNREAERNLLHKGFQFGFSCEVYSFPALRKPQKKFFYNGRDIK